MFNGVGSRFSLNWVLGNLHSILRGCQDESVEKGRGRVILVLVGVKCVDKRKT